MVEKKTNKICVYLDEEHYQFFLKWADDECRSVSSLGTHLIRLAVAAEKKKLEAVRVKEQAKKRAVKAKAEENLKSKTGQKAKSKATLNKH
jgi:hypothetical protein